LFTLLRADEKEASEPFRLTCSGFLLERQAVVAIAVLEFVTQAEVAVAVSEIVRETVANYLNTLYDQSTLKSISSYSVGRFELMIILARFSLFRSISASSFTRFRLCFFVTSAFEV